LFPRRAILESTHGQIRDAVKLLQVAVRNNFTTEEDITEFLAIPTNKPDYLKYYFDKFSKIKSAVMLPLTFADYLFDHLEERDKGNQHNREKARNASYLFSCLCNEYRLMSYRTEVQNSDEFYMPEEKWTDKYKIGGKVKNQTI
jgi:hypothetical protein